MGNHPKDASITVQELAELLYDCWQTGADYGRPVIENVPSFPEWLRMKQIDTTSFPKYMTCEGSRCRWNFASGLCIDSHCPYCDAIGGSMITQAHFDNCPGHKAARAENVDPSPVLDQH